MSETKKEGYSLTVVYGGITYYIGKGCDCVLPIASDTTLGGVKVGLNLSIDEDGVLSATNTTYEDATETQAGLMSSTDKAKLNAIPKDAEPNQNAFSKVVANSDTIESTTESDVLNIEGSNIDITGSPASKKITFALSKQGVINVLGYTPVQTDTNTAHFHGVGVGLVGSGNDGISGGTFTYKLNLQSETLDVNNALVRPTSNANRFYPLIVDKSGKLATIVPWTDTIYTLPKATTGALGGIKLGYATSGKNYAIEIDSDGKAYVNVPWEDTSFVLEKATSTNLGGVMIGYTPNGRNYAIELDDNGKMFVNVPWIEYELEVASSSKLGGIKTGYTTNNKNYALVVDSSGNAYVSVPWSDTTYNVATTSANGLMSSTDKSKLDNIEDKANYYVLPTASVSVKGGVKVDGETIIIENEVIKVSDLFALKTDLDSKLETDVFNTFVNTTAPNTYLKQENFKTYLDNNNVAYEEDFSDYYKKTEVDTKLNEKANTDDIPTKISKLNNDSGYITKEVSDLTNYYTITEIQNLVETLKTGAQQVVPELPSEPTEGVIYLLGEDAPYEIYIYETGKGWIYLGKTTIDLTGYVKGESLTTDKIILGASGSNIKASSYSIVSVLGNDNTTIPTSLAVKNAIENAKYTLPMATTTTMGGVIIGANLKIDENGVLSAIVDSFELNVATDSQLGGVKVGYTENNKNYAVKLDDNNKMYVSIPWTDTTYTLPTMSASVKGGAKVGTGFVINGEVINIDTSVVATQTDLNNKVNKAGDTMTGTLVAPIIQTGSDANNYFQSQKFRGEGSAATYYHAVDFGYSGHNQVDFYEYGGTYNFWKNTTATATTDKANLVASFQLGKLVERSYTLTYPGKSGIIALTSDIVTYTTATTSANGLMSASDKAKLDGIESGANKYTLPVATSDNLGGAKIGYTENDKNYAVKLDSNNKMYVSVPWTDTNTTYTFTPNNPTLAWGTTSTIGTIGGQTFKITMPSNPNTDTHWTTMAYIGAKDSKSNAATTNGNTYLKVYDDSTIRSQHLIKGSGATSVISDSSGNVEVKTPIDNSTIKVGSNGLESHQVEVSINNSTRQITLNIL